MYLYTQRKKFSYFIQSKPYNPNNVLSHCPYYSYFSFSAFFLHLHVHHQFLNSNRASKITSLFKLAN